MYVQQVRQLEILHIDTSH